MGEALVIEFLPVKAAMIGIGALLEVFLKKANTNQTFW